jgi:hypothetical protein
MSDNTLLIAGTFAMNVAILGGVTYYLHSDYMNKMIILSSNINVSMANESNIVKSHAVKLAEHSEKTRQLVNNVRSVSSNASVLSSDFYTYYNVPSLANNVRASSQSMTVASNLSVGSGSNAITITGMPSGSSMLMFGSTLSMSSIDNVSRISAASNIIIGSSTGDFLHVGANGKVGINNSAPSEYLDVGGNIAGNNFIGSNLCLASRDGPICVSGNDLLDYVKYTDPLMLNINSQLSALDYTTDYTTVSAPEYTTEYTTDSALDYTTVSAPVSAPVYTTVSAPVSAPVSTNVSAPVYTTASTSTSTSASTTDYAPASATDYAPVSDSDYNTGTYATVQYK